jgi:elongation factor Ts
MGETGVELVKQLREETGARYSDCNKALKECGGDVKAALDWLRKKNLATGRKAAGRPAELGALGAKYSADGAVTVVELSANTDFVVANAEFQALLARLVDLAEAKQAETVEALLALPCGAHTAGETVQELAGKIGENIAARRVLRFTGACGYYIHFDYRQGAVVELTGVQGDAARALGKELGMQIVFGKPKYVRRDEVPAESAAKERELIAARLKEDPKLAGKPPQILTKIAEGQLAKALYAEVCLLDQPYFRDGAKTISQYLKEQGGEVGVKRFVALRVGE